MRGARISCVRLLSLRRAVELVRALDLEREFDRCEDSVETCGRHVGPAARVDEPEGVLREVAAAVRADHEHPVGRGEVALGRLSQIGLLAGRQQACGNRISRESPFDLDVTHPHPAGNHDVAAINRSEWPQAVRE